MFAHPLTKTLFWVILILVYVDAKAQQVKKIDCCKDVNPKATIIINDNTSGNNTAATVSTNPANGIFNFELKSDLNTSAGVYNSEGVLIRTLWNGVRYEAGCYEAQWDGFLDDGVTVAALGNYTIKVLTNNVQYTWEGGIGESSTEQFTNRKLRGQPQSMVVIGSTAYGAGGYSEHETAFKTFDLSDINLRTPPSGQTEMNSLKICTDGNIIYVGGDKSYDGTNGVNYASWVHGVHPGDINLQNPVRFAEQKSITANSGSGGLTDNNAIALYNPASQDYSGFINDLAVQRTGNFLFVLRAGLNQLQVYDKRPASGTLLKVNNIENINSIACDDDNNLYITFNKASTTESPNPSYQAIKKFTVGSNGLITDTGVSFTGITTASKITYSAALNRVAVFDNTTFQIKFFSANGGDPIKILGEAGGYISSPYFTSARFCEPNFLYYQDDNSLWLDQPSFNSLLHYTLNYVLKESSQSLPTSRCTAADQNDPTHIFSNYNEYVRDYSKPLDNGSNGSWRFVANWAKGANTANSNYDGLIWVNTFSNGHRYGVEVRSGNNDRFVELTPTGLRVVLDYFVGDVGRDGTLFTYGDNGSYHRQPTGIYRQFLTGFDSNNNPVWTSPVLWIANPAGTSAYDPWFGYQNRTAGQTAAADKYIYFNNGTGTPSVDESKPRFTLGAIKANTSDPVNGKILWKSARTTHYNYSGPYPADGSFDVGNNTGYFQQHSETHAQVYDKDVFWNVNGEFWQDTEANFWNHVDGETGLLIGHFGTNGNLARLKVGYPEMAGNAFSTAMVKVGNDYYIYHCDESVHPFVHSWHVTSLNTIKIITIPITVTKAINMPADPTDMMTGVPYKSGSFYGGSGWTMNPAQKVNGWTLTTTKNAFRADDNDIFIESDGNNYNEYRTVSRPLGYDVSTGITSVINTNNWTLNGSLKINNNPNDYYNIDLIDNSGKLLSVIRTQYDFFYINNMRYAENLFNAYLMKYTFVPFKIQNVNGKVSCSINNATPVVLKSYESGGNFNQPTIFRIRAGGNGAQHSILSIKGLKFSKIN